MADQHPDHTVKWLTVSTDQAGQRIDNFLMRCYRKVPKNLIYRVIRKGEVRVDKGRVKPHRKLRAGECVRVPPIKTAHADAQSAVIAQTQLDRIEKAILYEDADLMVINKPAGVAVHGGTGLAWGVIEVLRRLRPQAKRMELVHRLDRDTSGCLLVAKKASVLKALHQQMRDHQVEKRYKALVSPHWPQSQRRVTLPLLRYTLASGERRVKVSTEGQSAESLFEPIESFTQADWVAVRLKTGRTHQIRVHASALGAPVVNDPKYAKEGQHRWFQQNGFTRLGLHAALLGFRHPVTEQWCVFEAPMDAALKTILKQLRGEL